MNKVLKEFLVLVLSQERSNNITISKKNVYSHSLIVALLTIRKHLQDPKMNVDQLTLLAYGKLM
jgi:hypothetical protein